MNGMELDTYQYVANAFDVSPGEPWYYALGLGGEAGEALEVIKKSYRIDAPPINVEALALELGDVLWYLAAVAKAYGLKLSTVAEMNITKLEGRRGKPGYPAKVAR